MDALLVPEMPLLLLDTTLGLQLHSAIGNPGQLLLMYFLLPITMISLYFRYDRMNAYLIRSRSIATEFLRSLYSTLPPAGMLL